MGPSAHFPAPAGRDATELPPPAASRSRSSESPCSAVQAVPAGLLALPNRHVHFLFLPALRLVEHRQRIIPPVGIQIVSCDLAHIGPDTGRVRFSRTFVGEPGSPASLRHLAHCLGGTSGIDADACLARIISFRQEPPSGPV